MKFVTRDCNCNCYTRQLNFLIFLILIPFASPRSQGTGRGECTYSSVENFVSRSLLHIDYIISKKRYVAR